MISIFDMALLRQNWGYKEYIFTECSLQYVGWFYAENSKSKKTTTERVTNYEGFNVKQTIPS